MLFEFAASLLEFAHAHGAKFYPEMDLENLTVE